MTDTTTSFNFCRAPSSPRCGGRGSHVVALDPASERTRLGRATYGHPYTTQAAADSNYSADVNFESAESIVIQHLPAYTSIQCDFHCVSEYGEDSLGQRVTFKTKQGIPPQPPPPNVTVPTARYGSSPGSRRSSPLASSRLTSFGMVRAI